MTFGITGHNRGYEAYPETRLEEQISLAAELGSKIYRFNFNPVRKDDFIYLDRVLSLCESCGMELMLVLDDNTLPLEKVEERMTSIGTHCRGRVAYYQIFNEIDIWCMHNEDGSFYHLGNGDTLDDFNPARLELTQKRLSVAVSALRVADPQARLTVNFAWKHFAALEAFAASGIHWDIVGWDWYSDMEHAEPLADYFQKVVKPRFPGFDFMICECNIWAHQPYTESEQSDYLESFIHSMLALNDEHLKSTILYELLDEPAFDNGEAHFGLVTCTRDGKVLCRKEAFERIRRLIQKKG